MGGDIVKTPSGRVAKHNHQRALTASEYREVVAGPNYSNQGFEHQTEARLEKTTPQSELLLRMMKITKKINCGVWRAFG